MAGMVEPADLAVRPVTARTWQAMGAAPEESQRAAFLGRGWAQAQGLYIALARRTAAASQQEMPPALPLLSSGRRFGYLHQQPILQ